MRALYISVLAALVCLARAEPDGAPLAACETMSPDHHDDAGDEVDAQPIDTNPYDLIVWPMEPYDHWMVTIEADDGTPFKGFFIQAMSSDGTQPIGTWWVDEEMGDAKFRPCPDEDSPENGATHTDNTDKTSVTLGWYPDEGADMNDVVFVATVVQERVIFWTDIMSEPEV